MIAAASTKADAPDQNANRLRWSREPVFLMLLCAICHAFAALFVGVSEPLIDQHSFRQTQTALSTYWIAQGHPLFAYETPVLGAPWSIPFEFPLFQYVVALLSRTGLSLDVAGRSVSFAFFVGSVWPLHRLCRNLGFGSQISQISATLYLACPLLLYWGRAFLIESCATFFSLLWLAFVSQYLRSRTYTAAVASGISGCLAVLVKATTFPAFMLLGFVLAGVRVGQRARCRRSWIAMAGGVAAVGTIPLGVGLCWTRFADLLKENNTLGSGLTSKALTAWNFGSIGQRFSHELWVDTIWKRSLPDILGYGFPLALVVLGAGLTSRRHTVMAGACLCAFLTPFLVFTNLYIVHTYYQAANAVLLICVIVVCLDRLQVLVSKPIFYCVVLLLVVGQLLAFHRHFYPSMRLDPADNRVYEIALQARSLLAEDETIMVIGDDWSSMVPYYAQRRALDVPNWTPAAVAEHIVADPGSFLEGRPLGAIMACPDELRSYGALIPLLTRFLADRKTLAEVSGCLLLDAKATR